MMKPTFIALLALSFLCSSPLTAQATVSSDDIATYEKMIAEKQANLKIYQKLADAYFLKGDLKNAAKMYEYHLRFEDFLLPEYYSRYAKCLEFNKEFDKAREMYLTVELLNEEFSSGSSLYLKDIDMVSGRYLITPFQDNSGQTDFAPSFYKDQLVFSSARMDKGKSKNSIDPWTGIPYRNLYSCVKKDAEVSVITPFVIEGDKGLRGSTTVFTEDGKTVYFTRDIHPDRKRGGNTAVLRIYQARFIKGKWRDVIELPFNSDVYSNAHPALSRDGKTLYFASNRPGGIGNSDLYAVSILDGGKGFGAPENLGSEINTEGKDTFPFVSKSGKLYFSSDGHPGLGGMDVFVTNLKGIGQKAAKVHNLGRPVNSGLDDITFIIDETTRKGYFSSNRRNGTGKDDLYSFTEIESLAVKE